ncbi:hypothetical protein WME76_18335 [Sorangium sp. So ce119]|uniref:hypothetical protein n=1 Tax=Sorangium sp. So ce119 TaxID=3133279 RepID=UPI003F6407D1
MGSAENAVRAESLRLSGNYSGAIELFSDAISARPDYWWAYAHRAAARAALGNFVGAYDDFKLARPYYKSSNQLSWFLGQKAELFRLWARATLMGGNDAQDEPGHWDKDEDVKDAPPDLGRAGYDIAANQRPAESSSAACAHKAFEQMSCAIRLFSKAHDITDCNPWILAHRGATYTMRYWVGHPHRRFAGGTAEDFKLAQKDFEDACERNSGYGWAYAFHAVLVALYDDAPVDAGKKGAVLHEPGRHDMLERAMTLVGKASINGLDRTLTILRIIMALATYRAGKAAAMGVDPSPGFKTAAEYAWQTLQIDSEEAAARYFVADNVHHVSNPADADARHTIVRARAELRGVRARIIAMEGGLDCMEGKFAEACEKLEFLRRNFDVEAYSLVRRDPAWARVREGKSPGADGELKGLADAHKHYRRLFQF